LDKRSSFLLIVSYRTIFAKRAYSRRLLLLLSFAQHHFAAPRRAYLKTQRKLF